MRRLCSNGAVNASAGINASYCHLRRLLPPAPHPVSCCQRGLPSLLNHLRLPSRSSNRRRKALHRRRLPGARATCPPFRAPSQTRAACLRTVSAVPGLRQLSYGTFGLLENKIKARIWQAASMQKLHVVLNCIQSLSRRPGIVQWMT